MEMIVYFIIVVAVVGVLSSSVFIVAQTLRKRAERELNDEHWLTLVEALRDDLRSAEHVHWRPVPQKNQPERLLAVKRPDGTVLEWISDNGQLLRRVTDAKGKTVETPNPFQTTSWKLLMPKDGGKGLWDLHELPADTQISVAARPVFFYLTVGVHGQDRRIVTEQLGVSTRCEAQEARQ
jgi:type II secretory pathway pseudopilin PulG